MNANTGWGIQVCLCWKLIFTHAIYCLFCTIQCPSGLASNASKLRDFMLTYLTLWNHSIIIWETTVSFPFLPWSSWVLHLLPTPSFNSGFLKLEYLYWISRVLSKKQIFSCFPRIMRVSDIFLPFVVELLFCQDGWTWQAWIKENHPSIPCFLSLII